ncbi:hypothetical protein EDD16DRAFT_1688684 [Pisolithus croceorrhizus]|nr:hypothetical protein EDD16DRAFT_1688684 [Pisolithus croceorrhizus]
MSDTCLQGPPRVLTDPFVKTNNIKKRIIVCCDGTWQDGLIVKERWKYTNILKLSRALNHADMRGEAPVPQIVFYQSGIGSSPNFYSEYVQGTTGSSLGEKIQEAYAFIAQNYSAGDEIFLFGFSRGAYTARMVAMLIGIIGVLDKTNMNYFEEIFATCQKLGKSTDKTEIARLNAQLEFRASPEFHKKERLSLASNTFSIKCVGVFDTVGSVGLPEEITHKSPSTTSVFGFPNTWLGDHIERAYQALAINETRVDFDCTKFEQTESGRGKGQILKQVRNQGLYMIGGGWHEHDLSDLTLTWMIANIEDMLSVDLKYVARLPDPVAPWGQQPPHDPRTGVFILAKEHTRQLPSKTDQTTHETVHPSVLEQAHLVPQLVKNIQANPSLVCGLLPLEEQMKRDWDYDPMKGKLVEPKYEASTNSLWGASEGAISILAVESDSGLDADGWLARLTHESHVGSMLRAFQDLVDNSHSHHDHREG